jgi:hypothetical protein
MESLGKHPWGGPKEKENGRLSALWLGRARPELPGARRNPQGLQSADLFTPRGCVFSSQAFY